MKERKKERKKESVVYFDGGILRRRKREISRDLETKKFLPEEKSSEKRRFTRFPGKFPVFAVLIYPPGVAYACGRPQETSTYAKIVQS